MTSSSKLDKEVFNEFYNNRSLLTRIANEIRSVVSDNVLSEVVKTIGNEDDSDSVLEGQVLFRVHKVRERNTKLVAQKKKKVFEQTGRLECEVCLFDFGKEYGDLGLGYIECHHIIPLSNFKAAKQTRIEDLALVCSNCHNANQSDP